MVGGGWVARINLEHPRTMDDAWVNFWPKARDHMTHMQDEISVVIMDSVSRVWSLGCGEGQASFQRQPSLHV